MTGAPFSITNGKKSTLRYLAVAINATAAGYLAYSYIFSYPFTNAWTCYPDRKVGKLIYGYCPQYTGNYINNYACEMLQSERYNSRCDPDLWKASIHSTATAIDHFVFHLALAAIIIHILEAEQCLYSMHLKYKKL